MSFLEKSPSQHSIQILEVMVFGNDAWIRKSSLSILISDTSLVGGFNPFEKY